MVAYESKTVECLITNDGYKEICFTNRCLKKPILLGKTINRLIRKNRNTKSMFLNLVKESRTDNFKKYFSRTEVAKMIVNNIEDTSDIKTFIIANGGNESIAMSVVLWFKEKERN